MPMEEKKTTTLQTSLDKDSRIASICRLAAAGWSDEDIGTFFMVTKQAIQKIRKKYGIPPGKGKRGPDKMPRGHHALHDGDDCPAWLFGVWPGTPGWPKDINGKPVKLIGWNSCPPGRHLLEQPGGISKVSVDRTDPETGRSVDNPITTIEEVTASSREQVAAAGRCHEEWRPKLADIGNGEIHQTALECLREDELQRRKRDASGMGQIEDVKIYGHGQRRST